jgi:hypothetical protein
LSWFQKHWFPSLRLDFAKFTGDFAVSPRRNHLLSGMWSFVFEFLGRRTSLFFFFYCSPLCCSSVMSLATLACLELSWQSLQKGTHVFGWRVERSELMLDSGGTTVMEMVVWQSLLESRCWWQGMGCGLKAIFFYKWDMKKIAQLWREVQICDNQMAVIKFATVY